MGVYTHPPHHLLPTPRPPWPQQLGPRLQMAPGTRFPSRGLPTAGWSVPEARPAPCMADAAPAMLLEDK